MRCGIIGVPDPGDRHMLKGRGGFRGCSPPRCIDDTRLKTQRLIAALDGQAQSSQRSDELKARINIKIDT